ncbi:P-loop containing nucleoside triphosphate hydrolase protein [Amylostereum chailletii]|nr:P-loop containing nucleoside triphosphate hydrolase protein [Amylostereum chailletii]
MDAVADDLAQVLVHRLEHKSEDERLLVGVAGVPASGKSTLAVLVIDKVNALLRNSGSISSAVLVGLDGWHLTRVQLDAMPDPKLAHDRRGIHWTFDAHSYVSFDPTPHAVTITPNDRIVIIEGLYTFLSIAPWAEAGTLLDERWHIELDPDAAARRLVKRHVASGIAKDLTEAQWRSDENDAPNGRFIVANMLEPTRIIPSIEDPVFTS